MINKITLILLSLCSITYSQNDRGYIVETNQKSPTFSISLNNNQIFDLEDNRGKVIMLQFTASWCSVCLKEMPFIENEIWTEYKQHDDFMLIGLAKDTEKRPQEKKEIELMIHRTGVSYPIVSDHNSTIFHLFAEKNSGVTRNVIIDQDGNIAFLTRLFEREEFNEMKEVIHKLLNR